VTETALQSFENFIHEFLLYFFPKKLSNRIRVLRDIGVITPLSFSSLKGHAAFGIENGGMLVNCQVTGQVICSVTVDYQREALAVFLV